MAWTNFVVTVGISRSAYYSLADSQQCCCIAVLHTTVVSMQLLLALLHIS